MKERPILFSGPMVRAILEGRKTQTRRIAKEKIEGRQCLADEDWEFDENMPCFIDRFGSCPVRDNLHLCPYGVVGDRLWVRETFAYALLHPDPGTIIYRADFDNVRPTKLVRGGRWKPSIFMPKEDCRIRLEITDVRIEKLNDISEHDALAEGVSIKVDASIAAAVAKDTPARMEFWHLWESINSKRGFGWTTNPWVWVLNFKRINL